ncbi:MAG: hypothetical protein LAT84_09275 [Balneolia bacterium]|nr:hypothetical protein [Balneolia bacterium]
MLSANSFLTTLLLSFSLLFLSACGGDTQPDAAEPPVFEDSEIPDGVDLPDRTEAINDFTDQAHLLISGSEDLEPGEMLAMALPEPAGRVSFIIQRNNPEGDNIRKIEGAVAAPHGGFFEIEVRYGQLRGYIQTNNPRTAHNIYHQADMDTYELIPVTDRDQIDGGALLDPPVN